MITRFPAHRSAEEGTKNPPCERGARKKMFLQSCRPASVSPENKVAITEQSQEGLIYALQSRLTLSKDLLRKTSWSFKIIARSYAIQHFH